MYSLLVLVSTYQLNSMICDRLYPFEVTRVTSSYNIEYNSQIHDILTKCIEDSVTGRVVHYLSRYCLVFYKGITITYIVILCDTKIQHNKFNVIGS